MARNGSGAYTLSDTIASGTLADASELQAILDDIATALDSSICEDGQTVFTAAQAFVSGTASAPGITWVGDLDSGLYRIAANNLGVSVNGAKVLDIATTGATITGTLAASSDFAIATSKFTVTASSGNTVVAGTLALTGDYAINTNKFTVAASSGNTVVAGTLTVALAATMASIAATGITGTNITGTGAISGATVAGAMVASQAQQETGTATDAVVSPGRQHFHNSAVKGWAKLNASGTALRSYNVSSITDTGTGQATVNWTTAFSDGDYAVVATAQAGSGLYVEVSTIASNAVLLFSRVSNTGVLTDATAMHVIACGDFA